MVLMNVIDIMMDTSLSFLMLKTFVFIKRKK